MIVYPRNPDVTIKQGTTLKERITFRTADDVYYWPDTVTLRRVDELGAIVDLDAAVEYSGAAATGGTFEDTPDEAGLYIYEWIGVDADQDDVASERIVRVTSRESAA